MTPAELDAVRARAEAATPGPWHDEHHIGDKGQDYGCVSIGNYGWVTSGPAAPEYDVDSPQGHADAEFIAHARTDVPALLALVAELTRERDEARQRIFRVFGEQDDGRTPFAVCVSQICDRAVNTERRLEEERDQAAADEVSAEAKGRRWAIEALRDRDALVTYRQWGETTDRVDDGSFCILDARDLWSVSDYLEALLAQPTTEETP